MVDVSTSVVINRPRDHVAAVAADPDRITKWYANIHSVIWMTDPPLSRGSKLQFHARFLRRKLVYTYEVTEWEPGEKLVMKTSQGPFPMETSYEWKSADRTTTRMTIRNRGKPSGFWRLLGPLMSKAIGRENRKDLQRLKALLETG